MLAGVAQSGELAVGPVWGQQTVWSQAADAAKWTIGRALTAGLLLGITAAGGCYVR
jgi:hypothetical protein